MSTVSSFGGGNQALYQFYQSLLAQDSPATAATNNASPNAASATGASQAIDPTQQTASTQQADPTEQAAPHHHRHGHGGGGLLSKIESAVTSALQSAQSDGSSTDPNTLIQNAIAGVFNDITSPSGAAGASSGSAPGSTGAIGATGSAASDPNAARQAFSSLLQSFGVDPQQFRSDFLSAIKSAQNGSANTSTAFQSFPLGSALDTVS